MSNSPLSSPDTPRKYSDNPHTIKNRMAREKADEKQLFIMKAKNSTRAQVSKLKSRYVKDEKDKLEGLDEDSRAAHEKALQLQAAQTKIPEL